MRHFDAKITPLHQAVIDGDGEAFTRSMETSEFFLAKDGLGFTPLELAQLLGRTDYYTLLLKGKPELKVKIKAKGSSEDKILSSEDFQRFFGVAYRSFLTFESYDFLKKVIENCPYLLRSAYLAQENLAWGEQYSLQLTTGATANVAIKWIDETFNYGLFANEDMSAGTYVGEYAGRVRRLFRSHPDQNAYCFRYPTKLWCLNYVVVDALKEGNVMRFVNHSDAPNMLPICAVERGLLHQLFISNQDIQKGSELTFNYGPDYWLRRRKAAGFLEKKGVDFTI